MVGKNNQKERRNNGKAGTLERSSAFCVRKDETATKHGHEEAAPPLQDHWACLQRPESLLILVHAQPFSSSTINLLMLF